MSKEKQIDRTIEYLNNAINVERNSYFGKGCITMPLIEADKILDILQGYRKQSEWISVEERLPDREGTYLVYTYKGAIKFGDFRCYYAKNDNPQFDYYVTHWMPLPEAPKMKGGGE